MVSPLADSAPAFVREEFLRVDQVGEQDTAVVLDMLQSTAASTAPLIYVHGYNISFEKGCRRAVSLQQNANLAGRFLWFSWPSDGGLAYYTHDEADLYWSVPDLADAIVELERRFGGGVADVVGHSRRACRRPAAGEYERSDKEARLLERRASMTWAQRLKRMFGIDIETCPACGGRVRIVACIEDPYVIENILMHVEGNSPAQY